MVSSSLLSVLSLALAALSPVAAVTVRINELGDSITGSPGCWRALLWQKLQNAGITNTDFVGTLPAQGCGFTYDGDNDGHGGYLATGIVSDNQLPGWLAQTRPDIVTMMLGTNDVWNHLATSTILAAFTTLVGQMRAQNPDMVIMVAQITPMNPSGCSDCTSGVVALDAAIPAWAAGISTSQSPVTVVDLFEGYSTSSDTVDGVHPNDSGNTKIANAWFAPMSAAIQSFGSGFPSPHSHKYTEHAGERDLDLLPRRVVRLPLSGTYSRFQRTIIWYVPVNLISPLPVGHRAVGPGGGAEGRSGRVVRASYAFPTKEEDEEAAVEGPSLEDTEGYRPDDPFVYADTSMGSKWYCKFRLIRPFLYEWRDLKVWWEDPVDGPYRHKYKGMRDPAASSLMDGHAGEVPGQNV
ncbi:Uu.00g111560.m01.CDS01 [Anthostomella pinea]|uniref:Uu.00g111560.m01.CDS01 n=1 Tax=Anthostomella pinea TaxID=933095 RepID=A0AAI8YDY8_9PEZI|nr:Uu.00g111560.m01.CDS01 [Anthostomella pinea]